MEATIFTILFGAICLGLQWWGNRNLEKEGMVGVFLLNTIPSHERIPLLYRAKRKTKDFLVRRLIVSVAMLLVVALAWVSFLHWTTLCFLVILAVQAYLTREAWIYRRMVRQAIASLSKQDKESFEIYERGANACL